MNKLLFLISFLLCQSHQEIQMKSFEEICLSIDQFNDQYQSQLEYSDLKTWLSSQSEIGRGSFGVVYKVNFDNQDLIVKQISIQGIQEDLLRQLFIREVNMLSLFQQHPQYQNIHNCVYSKENSVNVNKVYIFGDFYTGDLSKMNEKFLQKLDAPQRVKLYVSLMKALMDLHAKGYIHSDLKPDNIMSEDENFTNLRIIDLGMVTEIGKSVIGGTPFYMPVQSFFDNTATEKFDSFSMAMTIMTLETNYKLPELFYVVQVKNMQTKLLSNFRKSSSIKAGDQVGWLRSIWHKIKRFFGFTVIENFSDVMECMIKYPSKNRCGLQFAIDKINSWEITDRTNEIPEQDKVIVDNQESVKKDQGDGQSTQANNSKTLAKSEYVQLPERDHDWSSEVMSSLLKV